ncbi:undecaprenyldiphospho-muramoylpentapeptide beta-N-acetylglucosaminyltransferase [Parasutterella secunda]|uniref:undecaprenyldiphospho-muramoylpentapeptide beta-N-acetylglucosaminyltransferase n=1 Tax=Parasutterella secunda TaxID=626947 RepID=UPI0025A42B1C|nr:undecaprenyldiphospho-muramoylpentapeptide beta-N-acetylglucosaminyltransferase [Parasutterella secunda]MDM8218105.1 undecaprenyldiphospho-muramoylpentapeptide beta-N-acetylglucosaminyltransferase [Parasutterella secunda]MDM8227165.1 undecaprenyldiphospho-muramoylpentapeptide beta-N-acetylglucosaminyltransferase [Parasutterella secunda]
MQTKHLIIAAAGTGGHVMPGLAVAEEMKKRGWTVSWIGTPVGMESRLVGQRNIEFDALDFTGMRGKGIKHMFTGALKLVKACFAAKALVEKRQASAMFSTGGYIAVPAAFGARSKNKPLIMMNCDAGSLMSVRAVMPWAQAVMCGFDGECAHRAGSKAIVSGNPVREDILALPEPQQRYAARTGKLNLLVFGGSLGAKVLNETVPAAIAKFPLEERPVVTHQCGKNAVEDVKALYAKYGVEAQVISFIDDMASAYNKADVVVCRAGATTVSELTAGGIPAILVPFVVSTTQHQLGNARYMQDEGAGILLEQKDLSPDSLYEKLRNLTREDLLTMADKARSLAKRGAAKTVADTIERLAKL